MATTTNNPGQTIYEDKFGSWTYLDRWKLRGDIIAWIPEQQLQNVQLCGNVTKALKSSSQRELLQVQRLDIRIKFLFEQRSNCRLIKHR